MKKILCILLISLMAGLVAAQENYLALIDMEQIYGKKIPSALLNTVSINYDNTTLENALSDIRGQSGILLNYNREDLPLHKPITLQMDNVYALEALISVLNSTNNNLFITKEGQIVISVGEPGGTGKGIRKTGRASIVGKVVDGSTGEPLPGANLIIKGTSLGTATNIEGEFTIVGVPAGNYTLEVTYIGYSKGIQEIFISPNRTTEAVFSLKAEQIQGEEIVITAQAAGQIQAMNQQVSAKTVTNIVSSKQIQELPEANAAEAVGRLPGVALERSGGEGNKIVIRGMAAKYSLVQIDGVNMAATGYEDRSTDLSMISPYMLEGIELTKSVMANQEATATGGIVNFRVKKASASPSFNIITQGGYNSLRDTFKDFKISTGASNRYFSNLIGVYAQVDYEEKDAGSQQLGNVSFDQQNETSPVRTNSLSLKDIFRNVQRTGGALVLDYSSPTTEIKSSNFYSRIKREETRHQNNYNFLDQGYSLNFTDIPERALTIWTNSLQINHRWLNWEINSAFSHSYSLNDMPLQISSTNSNSPSPPFDPERNQDFNVDLDPETIPDLLIVDIDDAVHFMNLDYITRNQSKTHERDLSGKLDLAYSFDLNDQINVKLSMGGKYKHKSKEYDNEAHTISGKEYVTLVYETFKDQLSNRSKERWITDNRNLYLEDFMDKDYNGSKFLDGRYEFSPIFDKEMFRKIHDVCWATYDPDNTNYGLWDLVKRNFVLSNYYDYNGTEDYYAFYVMPEINIGPKLLFVPGVRYEANRTEYTGYRGDRLGELYEWRATYIDTVTKVRTNEFFLPMIQTFYKPTDWLTIKAGYTHTLQRPNYNNIMPGWVISTQGQIGNLSNFRLKPELAKNWDLQLSLHSNKIGLLAVGAFYKNISDMIFATGQKAITDTLFFELPTLMYRKIAAYTVNNENEAINYGYEVEWQSNFWYLPGLLRGLVMNVNYTRNKSEAEYLKTRVIPDVDENYNPILTNNDTTYTSPMIQQPDHLLNLTVGYDIKGFSIRWAMRYKSNIFTSNNWYEELRGYSTDFYRYDLSVRQKLPINGLECFLNINNLTNEHEHNVINHMNYTSYIESYGRNGNVGFRYQF